MRAMKKEWREARKPFIIIVIIVLCAVLGVALGLIQRRFQIDLLRVLIGCWIVSLVCWLAWALYNLSYWRKLQALLPLLRGEKAREYIRGVEKLLQTAKGKGLKTSLRLNLAVGYMEVQEFDTARSLLEELSDKQLNKDTLRLIRCVNLFQCYFQVGRYDEGLALYHANRSLLQWYENDEAQGGGVAVVNILAAIQEGRREEAQRLLDAARNTWSDPRFQTAAQKIEDVLAQQSPGEQQ